MEKKLASLLDVYNSIPTLDAAKAWIPDAGAAKPGIFRLAHPAERQQTIVTKEYKTVSEATPHHPAQVVQDEQSTVVGKYIVTDFSGAISSADKAAKLKKLTSLIRAVKAARQRANATTVNTELSLGHDLLNYINS